MCSKNVILWTYLRKLKLGKKKKSRKHKGIKKENLRKLLSVKAQITCCMKSFSIFGSILEVKFYTPEQPWLILLPAVPLVSIFFHLCSLSLALLNAAFPSWGRVMRSPIFHYSIWSKNLICMLNPLWNQWSLSPLKRYLTKWEAAHGTMMGTACCTAKRRHLAGVPRKEWHFFPLPGPLRSHKQGHFFFSCKSDEI